MRNIFKAAIVLAAISLPSVGTAGYTGSGYISNLIVQPSGQMFFDLSGTHAGKPSCAGPDRWVINTSSPGGQATAAAVLTAFSLRKPIGVQGNSNCDVWADTETTSYIIITN